MSHTRMLYFQAHHPHANFQDNHASVTKKEAAVGANHVQAPKKQVRFQDNHANPIKKDDVNTDVDSVASDFIKPQKVVITTKRIRYSMKLRLYFKWNGICKDTESTGEKGERRKDRKVLEVDKALQKSTTMYPSS
ncbi:hypothetical protein VPH35_048264 [Triticum aestivum]|uniref:Uncharacterized protein n=2 Tax=Triticum TaxID=4564 RepID=A0A9R0VUH2_TRITD|nr:unnamed protein product [Triticum turgidum subsp. durum]